MDDSYEATQCVAQFFHLSRSLAKQAKRHSHDDVIRDAVFVRLYRDGKIGAERLTAGQMERVRRLDYEDALQRWLTTGHGSQPLPP